MGAPRTRSANLLIPSVLRTRNHAAIYLTASITGARRLPTHAHTHPKPRLLVVGWTEQERGSGVNIVAVGVCKKRNSRHVLLPKMAADGGGLRAHRQTADSGVAARSQRQDTAVHDDTTNARYILRLIPRATDGAPFVIIGAFERYGCDT